LYKATETVKYRDIIRHDSFEMREEEEKDEKVQKNLSRLHPTDA